MPLCFVSIGSNIERERNIGAALVALRRHFGPLLVSSVYETAAVGFTGEPFYNLVAAFASDLQVERLREQLVQIETAQGRTRGDARHGPRTLDIDILLYGELVRHDHRHDIPRREIRDQTFVLGPLTEIAADLRNPETGECIGESWKKFEGNKTLTAVRFALHGD